MQSKGSQSQNAITTVFSDHKNFSKCDISCWTAGLLLKVKPSMYFLPAGTNKPFAFFGAGHVESHTD
jgi:hypothetical protein